MAGTGDAADMMVIFPRLMITAFGVAILVILILAARDFFPHHMRLAQTIAAAIGVALNVPLQNALWSGPVSR
jgi:hypothetical protein